jgi:hypothetical protein
MHENKTKITTASPAAYIEAIKDDERKKDCKALSKIMTKVTGEKPKMFGTSIVAFGKYHYKYASGHEGDSCLTGFSSRKAEISVYLMQFPGRDKLEAKLGKHKSGKGCLYIKKMSDVDPAVLEKMIDASVAYVRKTYPS